MLEEKIYREYLEALKARDKEKLDFLSFIRAELKNAAINVKKDKLDDNNVLVVIKKQKKRLEEAKESTLPSGRTDLLQSIEKELAILDSYLPQPLEESQLVEIINQTISALGAASMKDMGRVMKEVLAQVGVRADTKRVSELVKSKLSSP